jgi:beta-lactamase superfamily II metal-dependent hydrolase
MDHLSGLNALNDNITISNIWITDNDCSQDEDKLSESEIKDWELYKKYRNNIEGKVKNTTVLSLKEGSEGQYYSEDGIDILSPSQELIDISIEKDNKNIMSTVLLIRYGECKIVLAGDAEEDSWEFIKDNYFDDIKDISILGAAHHGRDSGYHQESVKQMSPEYTVVSVGKKPKSDASNKYRQYSDNVYSTRWKGNITFECYKDGSIIPEFEYNR